MYQLVSHLELLTTDFRSDLQFWMPVLNFFFPSSCSRPWGLNRWQSSSDILRFSDCCRFLWIVFGINERFYFYVCDLLEKHLI